ncbi:portal protein [Roseibium sediminis]|uniref:portal protein n=1 Tax=Roseibium sediminis TaxID=1775174 RepID=UPI00123D42EB|nr:portal protein [Roseibium sediminis]
MGVVDDLKTEFSAAQSLRQGYESDWRDYVAFTAPDMEKGFEGTLGKAHSGVMALQSSAARQRSRHIHDGTAVWLLDRLTSGVESLTTPKGFPWHGITSDDPFAPDPTQEEEEYFDTLRDHLFRIRYSDKSGFALSNRSKLKSTVKLGTGVMYLAENDTSFADIKTPIFYRYIPLHEVYLIVDAQGNDCGFFRERTLQAWQIVKEYGEKKVSSKVREDAGDPKRKTRTHTIVQACMLREGGYAGAVDAKKSLYEAIHFETETKHICKQGGFFDYPLSISRWDRDGLSPYGSPPQAKLMGDIKSLQKLAKDGLTASGIAVRPALAVYSVERPIDFNPGRVNPGMIDEQGRRLYAPMHDAVNPGASSQMIEAIREQLRIGLYGDLWQTLLEGNGRTATEANIRRQEMADMIGPFTTNIQAGHGPMFDREIGILGKRGAFEEGSPLAPPQSLSGEITVASTAPIDQMREAGNFEALMGFEQYLGAKAQTDPTVLDWVDGDESADMARRSLGLPAKLLRKPEEVEKLRAQRAEQQQQQEQMAMGESMARMAKDGAPMAQLLAEQAGGDVAGG